MEDRCYSGKRGQMRNELNDLNGLNALDEGVLAQVSGGAENGVKIKGRNIPQVTKIACSRCGNTFLVNLSKSEVKCKYCGFPNQLSG